jgi:transcriptional regulator with XRE-family HTH domain
VTVAVPVGNRLRALRRDRGLMIPQLAAATGLTNGSSASSSATSRRRRSRAAGTAGEELYSLPADVEIVSVVEGSLELQIGETIHVLRAGESFTYAPRDAHTWRNPSATEPAVVLWLAVPNPYAQL